MLSELSNLFLSVNGNTRKVLTQLSTQPLEQCRGTGMIYYGSGSYFLGHSAFGSDPAPAPDPT